MSDDAQLTRRRLLGVGLGVAVGGVLAGCARDGGSSGSAGGGQPEPPPTTSSPAAAPTTGATSAGAPATTLAPTPECRDADDVTPAQTEGPYFKASSPQKTNLYADVGSGTRLTITGAVLTTQCQPVSRALVDLWQCDANGQYDNQTYRLRGHLFTDQQGGFRVDTVFPGIYTGRTRHIHVKVQAPNGPVLTTQLYFPNEPANARDGIYRPECEMDVKDTANGKDATFNFVVRT